MSRASFRLPRFLFAFAACLALVGSPVFADDAQNHFDKATALYKAKKYDASLEEFNLARKASPQNANVLFWIGFLNLQMQRYPDALEPLQEAIKIKPDVFEAHLNLGNVYDGLKRYPDAAQEFQTAAKLQPKSPDPFYNLGSVYYKMNRLPDAITAYRKAAEINPNDAMIQQNLGLALQANGSYDSAIAALQTAVKIEPNSTGAWVSLGLAGQSLARKIQTLAATERNKADAERAWTLARTALNKAITLAPTDYPIRETYAESLFDMGRTSEAIPQFAKAADLKPDAFDPRYNLGLAYTRLQQYPLAVTAYQKALALAPENLESLRGLGLAQFHLKHYDEAATVFGRLTKAQPAEIGNWINLSSSLQRKGDEAGASAALEEALKNAAPGAKSAQARRALAGYYYRKGDADSLTRAEMEYNQALKEAPDNAEAYNGLGLIAQKQEKFDDAVRFFLRAVALNAAYADAYNNLGVAYESKRNFDAAVDAYKKALHIDPNNALARKNLDRFRKKP